MTERKTFVFVAGLHRSGTSLLHRALRNHPKISGFQGTGVPEDEGQHLQSVFPPARAFGGPGRFAFDARSHMDENHPLATAGNARKLWIDWRRYWDTTASYFVEKSPPNIVRTRFLQAMFPNSVFVIVLRHPIAVSYALRKWCPDSVDSLIEHWLVSYERFLADLPCLQRSFVLRYEQFVADPQGVLDQILQFIGLESAPHGEQVDGSINQKYFELWRSDYPDASQQPGLAPRSCATKAYSPSGLRPGPTGETSSGRFPRTVRSSRNRNGTAHLPVSSQNVPATKKAQRCRTDGWGDCFLQST